MTREVAEKFYNKCLAEANDGDVFSELMKKNAFDEFVKEEYSNSKQGPKLRKVKTN